MYIIQCWHFCSQLTCKVRELKLTALLMKTKFVWHVMPCRPAHVYCGNHFKTTWRNIPETRVFSKGIYANEPKQVALKESMIRRKCSGQRKCIRFENLRKVSDNFSRSSQEICRDLTLVPPKYEFISV
jgi:hypothetical protein